MLKLLSLLPCLLLISQAHGACEQLLACENVINEDNLFNGDGSLINFVDAAASMDALCGELAGLKTCIDANLNTCSDTEIRNMMKTVGDILEYMCTPEGRQ
ncbi:hypothetical protein EGW08_019517, partial [Elysia chlorotica]